MSYPGKYSIQSPKNKVVPFDQGIDTMDWQVESGSRTTVFLSATTSDLGECRQLAANILQQAGIFPVIQDYFGPDHRTIEEMLMNKILASDAVVCLVGHAYGATPGSIGGVERSYTQIEYDVAVRYEKPIYLFVATDEYALEHPLNEAEHNRLKQEAHRKTILSGHRKYQLFNSSDELEHQIYALVRPILEHSNRRLIKFQHIPPAPACFVGRTNEMAELNGSLDRRLPSVIVLLGMGGQGKSTLVAQTLRSRAALPFAAGIWVSAERGFTFSEFLDSALEAFMGSRFNKTEMPRLDIRARQLITLLQTKPYLIVIDAVERWLSGWKEERNLAGIHDLSLRQGAYEGLDEFLKETTGLESGSHIIITGRVLPAALDAVECTIVPVLPKDSLEHGLPALSQEAAVELLMHLGVIAPVEKLHKVAKSLVNHPLALTGFARVASRAGINWESLLSGKSSDPSRVFHELLDETRKHLPDRGRSEQLLKIAACFPEGATLEALDQIMHSAHPQATTNTPDILSQVLTLADWNILIWDSNTLSVRLHALVAEYFLELLNSSEQRAVHNLISKWYEAKASKSGMTAEGASHQIFAVKHAISANDGQQAMRLIFESHGNNPNLVDWLSHSGHFWECAELLHTLQHLVSGLPKVTCILTRAQLLHELELSQLTLPDLIHAQEIIQTHAIKSSPYLQLLQAQCYGLQGLIHLETGKATDSLPLLDKSVLLFEALVKNSNDYISDLTKTLANRGLARWTCGDWNDAIQDYTRCIAFLEKSNSADRPELKMMIHELQARMAAIELDRGNATEAISTLIDVIQKMKLLQTSVSSRPTKNYFMALVGLSAAYIQEKHPVKALQVLEEVIHPIEQMSDHGRWEYNNTLAQALVNEAKALLLLGKTEMAKISSDKAVRLYVELIEKGARHFSGQLANALFRRSEAHIRTNQELEGISDLRWALELSSEWLREWFGESLIEKVFLENALYAISFLPRNSKEEKREILLSIQYLIERLQSSSRQSEAIVQTKQIVTYSWAVLKSNANELEIPLQDKSPFLV